MGVTNHKIESSPQRADDPYVGAVAIDYSGGDQTFTENPRGVLISTAGTLKMDFVNGTTATIVLAVGVYRFSITKIYQSGSATAAGHVLL
jgi:hypothetical protein